MNIPIKKTTRSIVWDHFVKSEDKQTAQCLKCSLKIKFCGNTTNLTNHLKGKHKEDFAFIPKAKPITKGKKEKPIEFVKIPTEPNDQMAPENCIVSIADTTDTDLKLELNDTICRVCLNNDANEYITEFYEYEIQSNVIRECTGIDIEEEHLPSTICYLCISNIRAAHQLRKTAQESERFLKERQNKWILQEQNKLENDAFDCFESTEESTSMFLLDKPTNPILKIGDVHVFQKSVNKQPPPPPPQQIIVEPTSHKEKEFPAALKKQKLKVSLMDDIFDEQMMFGNWYIIDETNKRSTEKSVAKKKKTNKVAATTMTAKENSTNIVKKRYKPIALVCEICAKVCRGNRFLMEHMNTHTQAKPYRCSVCPMRFNCSNSQNRHMRTHTKSKPYCCDLCSNTYRASHHLKYHKIHKHGTEADKKFRCNVCDKAFAFQFNLNAHLKDHCKGEKKTGFVNIELDNLVELLGENEQLSKSDPLNTSESSNIVIFDVDNYITQE